MADTRRYRCEVVQAIRDLLAPLVVIAVVVLVVFGIPGVWWLTGISITAVLAGGVLRSRALPTQETYRAELVVRVRSLESELEQARREIMVLKKTLGDRYRNDVNDALRQSILEEVAGALMQYDHGRDAKEALESLRRSLTRLSSG